MKQYRWEQEQIASMKEYIARFGHGSAKLARQAQSKEKTLAKMERGGLTEKVVKDRILVFRFTNVGKLPPPVLQFVEVTFGYTPDNLLNSSRRAQSPAHCTVPSASSGAAGPGHVCPAVHDEGIPWER